MKRLAAILAFASLVAGQSFAVAPVASPARISVHKPSRPKIVLRRSPIRHVVIIYQENHSFDEVLGAICRQRRVRCNGSTANVTLADGHTVRNRISPDIVPRMAHDPRAQRLGISNRWGRISGCHAATHYACVTHYRPRQIPNLTRLADRYAVSDATFAAGDAASFGAHVELGLGRSDGFVGVNPVPSKTGVPPVNRGWGCPSRRDAAWSDGLTVSFQPSCIPRRNGTGAYRPTRVPYAKSIMQQLGAAGLSWKVYNGLPQNAPNRDGKFNICNYDVWCWHRRRLIAYNPPWRRFRTDARHGALPNLALIPASGGDTAQHNGNSMANGDNYLGVLVKAAMHGPEWNSTAIFITYDDCGCFYDHVTPPSGLGPRNPMVIVSPWVKPSFTDSNEAVQPYSMLAFVDHNFRLRPLTRNVRNAYGYAKSFDLRAARPPTTATPPMVHQHISQRTKREVRRLAPTEEADPT